MHCIPSFILLLVNCLIGFCCCPSFAQQKPNVVIILVDDMGYSDIGCYGSEIKTPNIDRLAANGLRFSQFYNCGRCCPTRASLMTGLHPHQVGIGHMTHPPEQELGFTGPYQGYLNQQCTTLAQVLKSAGYRTIMTGKWHLGYHSKSEWPLQRGFDDFYGCLAGGFNYFKPGGNRRMMRGNEKVATDENFYATDTLTDEACRYVSHVPADQPFFLYLAYNAPHWPVQPKVEDFEKYRGKYSDGWQPMMNARFKRQVEMGLFDKDTVPAPHVGPTWDSLNLKQQEKLGNIQAAYAACIDSIDQNVGKLVRHLDEQSRLDNTVIFFLSDNGACQEGGRLGQFKEGWIENPPLESLEGIRQGLAWANASNTPFRLYKHFVHEGGACTPCVVHWPRGIQKQDHGKFVRQFAYLPDIMPTCLELSGASYPEGIPPHVGKSILPLIKGTDQPIHDEPIFWEHEGNCALRWGNWKLVKQYKKPWELYDIANDRTEMNDLASSNKSKRDQLIVLWESWAKRHAVAYPERFNMYEFLQRKRNNTRNNDK